MRVLSTIAVPAVFTLLTVVGSASAQDAFDDDGFLSVPAPAAPAPASPDELVDPDVTIIETDDEVIYEYRVNGQIYMVKIQPVAGPPYYMMDIDGDGLLDVQNQRPPELAVPQWLLFSW